LGGFFVYNELMKSHVKAKWSIRLGNKVELKVKVGDDVIEGQVLGSSQTGELKLFDVSMVLSRFSREKINDFFASLVEKEVKTGDLMVDTGGMFGKKIFSPSDGTFLGVDEFYNIKIKLDEEQKRIISSPVNGIVEKIDKEKMTIAFNAIEFRGRSIIDGKVWGNCSLDVVNKITDLDFRVKGKIILSSSLDNCFLTKAEVVGAVAVLVHLGKDEVIPDRINSDLPILGLDANEWDNLIWHQKEGKEKRMLLNSKNGRVLMVIE